MLSFLIMCLSDYIVNEELWENFMDAILLMLIPSPWERSKAIFGAESEAARGECSREGRVKQRGNKSDKTWQLEESTPKYRSALQPCFGWNLWRAHPTLSFTRATTCVICMAPVLKDISFLATSYFITQRRQPWKKQWENKSQPAELGISPLLSKGKHDNGRR